MGGLQKGGSRIPLRLKEVGVSCDYYDELDDWMINWMITIVNEMNKGNFSFLILIVGTLQLFIMLATYHNNNRKK